MEKIKVIEEIKKVIDTYGKFDVVEVETEYSPCISSMGGFVALAEVFDKKVTIEVYNTTSVSCDSVSSYILNYEEIDLDVLNEIYKLAMRFKKLKDEE